MVMRRTNLPGNNGAVGREIDQNENEGHPHYNCYAPPSVTLTEHEQMLSDLVLDEGEVVGHSRGF